MYIYIWLISKTYLPGPHEQICCAELVTISSKTADICGLLMCLWQYVPTAETSCSMEIGGWVTNLPFRSFSSAFVPD